MALLIKTKDTNASLLRHRRGRSGHDVEETVTPAVSRYVLDELNAPPSSSRFCPTMKLMFAEQRKAQASPNSAGSPARPAGVPPSRSCTISSTGRLLLLA